MVPILPSWFSNSYPENQLYALHLAIYTFRYFALQSSMSPFPAISRYYFGPGIKQEPIFGHFHPSAAICRPQFEVSRIARLLLSRTNRDPSEILKNQKGWKSSWMKCWVRFALLQKYVRKNDKLHLIQKLCDRNSTKAEIEDRVFAGRKCINSVFSLKRMRNPWLHLI